MVTPDGEFEYWEWLFGIGIAFILVLSAAGLTYLFMDALVTKYPNLF